MYISCMHNIICYKLQISRQNKPCFKTKVVYLHVLLSSFSSCLICFLYSNNSSLTSPAQSLCPLLIDPVPADAVTTKLGREMVDISVAAAAAPRQRTKENIAEWSKILFKCIKPVGEPEFRIKEDIATHTITLRIDMTAIDLKHAEALCTREQVDKYEKLGMRREEITEVIMKLNAIRHLGINLRIDDLFDERGFMVVDSHTPPEEKEEPVYFVDDGKKGSATSKEKLIQAELARSTLADLSKEKEIVVDRERGDGRETDLLQSMTMKIRFMKKVTNDEMRDHLMSDSESVMFDSCDQVQMKLTQLELNTMRLVNPRTTQDGVLVANSVKEGDGQPTTTSTTPPPGEKSGYIHATESHRPFVDLLLEQNSKPGKHQKTITWSDKPLSVRDELEKAAKKDRKSSSSKPITAAPVHSEQVSTGKSVSLPPPVSNPKLSSQCIPSSTLSCQCFACVGAVAAQQTAVSLPPSIPSLTPSLPPFFTPSLLPSFPPSLSLSLPPFLSFLLPFSCFPHRTSTSLCQSVLYKLMKVGTWNIQPLPCIKRLWDYLTLNQKELALHFLLCCVDS